MRSLRRNQQTVYYKRFVGQEEIIDKHDNKTGSYRKKYSDLEFDRLCVSPNKGTSEEEMFGSLEEYDRTMTTANTACPIDEETILWLDGASVDEAHNYVVKRRSPWKNSISYAIQRVDVRHG